MTTDEQQDQIYRDAIPERTLVALNDWATRGGHLGHFLEAFLSNNLRGVFDRGDDGNLAALVDIWRYIFNRLPAGCYGTPERLSEWRARSGYIPRDHANLVWPLGWRIEDTGGAS